MKTSARLTHDTLRFDAPATAHLVVTLAALSTGAPPAGPGDAPAPPPGPPRPSPAPRSDGSSRSSGSSPGGGVGRRRSGRW